MARRRATSADVAARAGVSRATVSYVLNGVEGQKITEETAQRVRDAARDLGYVPFGHARALRRGRSGIVLCVSPAWRPSEPVDAFRRELASTLERHGLASFFTTVAEAPDSLIRLCSAFAPEAVVLLAPVADADVEAVERLGIPVIEVFTYSDAKVRAFTSLQFDIGSAMANHLLERGAMKLAFVGPRDPRERPFASNRLDGVRDAARVAGLGDVIVVDIDLTPASAREAFDLLLSTGVDGLCCHNDFHAIAMIDAARRAGVAVPDDLCVIGVDDIPAAPFVQPPLTSVRINIAHGALLAAHHVADRLGLALNATAKVEDMGAPLDIVERSTVRA